MRDERCSSGGGAGRGWKRKRDPVLGTQWICVWSTRAVPLDSWRNRQGGRIEKGKSVVEHGVANIKKKNR